VVVVIKAFSVASDVMWDNLGSSCGAKHLLPILSTSQNPTPRTRFTPSTTLVSIITALPDSAHLFARTAVVLLPVVPSCGTLPYCERPSTRPQQHGARPTECVTTTHRIATTDARSISHVVEAVLRLRHLTSGAYRFALATAVACSLRRRSSATGIHSR
jgi:hypothetical protein